MEPEKKCPHKRTRLIAKDDAAEYVECLDCGAILESSEMTDAPEFPESLSDA
jgi:transcription initiation factor TFIIIB Brf1 subunit/transcription initiation factor TFIIB